MNYYDDVGPVNIPPKAVIKLDLHDGSWNQNGELDFIWKTKKVYLTYLDEKNKMKRKLIQAEDYKNYFVNHRLIGYDNGQAESADGE